MPPRRHRDGRSRGCCRPRTRHGRGPRTRGSCASAYRPREDRRATAAGHWPWSFSPCPSCCFAGFTHVRGKPVKGSGRHLRDLSLATNFRGSWARHLAQGTGQGTWARHLDRARRLVRGTWKRRTARARDLHPDSSSSPVNRRHALARKCLQLMCSIAIFFTRTGAPSLENAHCLLAFSSREPVPRLRPRNALGRACVSRPMSGSGRWELDREAIGASTREGSSRGERAGARRTRCRRARDRRRAFERLAPRGGVRRRGLEGRDLALARMIAGAAMRRYRLDRHLLGELLARGMPRKSGPLEAILVTGAAQILFLDVADHAAVDLAIRLARADDRAQAFSGLANAVLRRLSREKAELPRPAVLPMPTRRAGSIARWRDTYGPTDRGRDRGRARQGAAARLSRQGRRRRLGRAPRRERAGDRHGSASDGMGRSPRWTVSRRANGGCRTRPPPCRRGSSVDVRRPAGGGPLRGAGRQDGAARRQPARRHGRRPGAGSARPADEQSRAPSPQADDVVADLLSYDAAPFDAVLLDAPCSATGHDPPPSGRPMVEDGGGHRRARGPAAAAARARRPPREARRASDLLYLLARARGGRAADRGLPRGEQRSSGCRPPGRSPLLRRSRRGDLRTLPSMLPTRIRWRAGFDGFFAARLRSYRPRWSQAFPIR